MPGPTPTPPETFSEKKMPEPVSAPKVLVSYSHDSPEHMARVLALSDRLRAEGIDSQVDQYETSPPEGWPRWTWNQVEWANFVLVACTATYNRRFRGQEEQGKGHGVNWEGVVITQDLYDAAARNTKFIPIVFSEEDAAYIPVILRGTTFYVVSTEEGYEALYRHVTNQPRTLKPGLGRLRPLPQRAPQAPADGYVWTATDSLPAPADAGSESGETRHERPRGRGGLLYALLALAACVVLAVGYWLLWYAPAHRGPVEYSGRILDSPGGKGVRGAEVSIESRGEPHVTHTVSDGTFSFKLGAEAGLTRIRVRAEGFDPVEARLQPGDFTELILRKPQPTPTPTPAPTPSPAPTRRPIIPRPKLTRVPCTVELAAKGLCK